MSNPPKDGDVVWYRHRTYFVVDLDRYGFFTLADNEGETIVRHFGVIDEADTFVSAMHRIAAGYSPLPESR